MELKIEGFAYDNSEIYKLSLELRNQIFVQELGFDKHLEFDGKDFKAMHYLLSYNQIPAGVARWNQKNDEIVIDRFGILSQYRKNGFGLVFIKFIINEILPSKKKILLYTTNENALFFTQYGFKDLHITEQLGAKSFQILNY